MKLEVGSKLVEQGATMPRVVELNSFTLFDCWRVMGSTSRGAFYDQVNGSGWNLFYIAGHLDTLSIGLNREDALRRGVRRLAARVRAESFNCMEVTEIKTRHFLGIPYLFISADILHIQRGFILDQQENRKQVRLANEWARR